MENLKKPKVKLSGVNGNALALVATVSSALKKEGYSKELISDFRKEALSGNYDKVLQTCMKWADVS